MADQAARFAEKVANLDGEDDVVSSQVTIFGSTYSVDATLQVRKVLFGLITEREVIVTMLANDEEVWSETLRDDGLFGLLAFDDDGEPVTEPMADYFRKQMAMAHDDYQKEK